MESRIDKINYYLDIAQTVAERSTCLRKKIGCILVNQDEVISTGYNGAPRGRKNCVDLGFCSKKKFFPNVRHAGYDACRSVHAEQNAIISARRKDMIGSSLYLVSYRPDTNQYDEGASCCQMCRKIIINAGISKIYIRQQEKNYYTKVEVEDWIEQDDLLEGKIEY